MADFRKMLFAFAGVALLAGLTVPASAQAVCTAGSGVNTLVRAESYNDLVGDILITCTGGTPTAQGVQVPPVDILVTLNGTITSKITANLTGGSGAAMSEALLLMDDPNSTKWNNNGGFTNSPQRGLLNCGANNDDTSTAGPGVCAIYAAPLNGGGNSANTYDGNKSGTSYGPSCDGFTGYGCSRPNVFQGRQASVLAGSVANTVQFLGVPVDPPGPTLTRTLRIVNVRVNGNGYGVASPYSTVPVVATISISNNSSIVLTNTSVTVGQVEQGLVSQFTAATFLQCESTATYKDALNQSTGAPLYPASGQGISAKVMKIRVLENFATSFKAKNVAQLLTYSSSTGSASNAYPTDNVQNVPGALYGTETGFYFPSNLGSGNGATEPPLGSMGTPVPNEVNVNGGTPFSSTYTGIASAGLATQGTRIAVTLDPAPAGTTIFMPTVVQIQNQANGNHTGIMQLITTDGNGANLSVGGYLPSAAATSPSGLQAGYAAITNGNYAVYEVLYTDQTSQEYADILPLLYYTGNLTTNTPPPGSVTGSVSFAPTYAASTGANLPSSTFVEPRFAPSIAPNATLYTINQCRCDLLFPWVVGGGGYTTSIVVDNTSADPFGTAGATGTVTFNYYGTNGVSLNPANTGTFAAQTTTAAVPPGSYAVDVITNSGGGGTAGLSSLSGPFAGYVISQANFQFCHGVASISGNGIQPQTYVGLQMDAPIGSRTGQAAEVLGN